MSTGIYFPHQPDDETIRKLAEGVPGQKRDRHGRPVWLDSWGLRTVATTDDNWTWYITDCCDASAKGLEYGTGCRACFEPVDDGLGGIPEGPFTPVMDDNDKERITMDVTTHEQYRKLLDSLAQGDRVGDETHAAMVAFAKAKKIKTPPPDNAAPEPKPKKERKPKKEKAPSTRTVNKGTVCSEDGCERPATSLGLCKMHHTAHWRKDPANLEKSRRAARKHAAKVRFVQLAERIGGGFHPDTKGADYTTLPDGITPERVDRVVDEANEYGLDVYALALDALKEG